MLRRYRIYGLELESDLEFPELAGATASAASIEPGSADSVRLVLMQDSALGPFELPTEGGSDGDRMFERRPRGCDLVWEGDARVRIEGGRRIEVAVRDGADRGALRAALLGPVMGLLLAQRSLLPLHASSVSTDGGSLALAGPSGGGKSTLAAALLERGRRLFADDVSAVDTRQDPPRLRAAFGWQKLDPASLRALGRSPEGLMRVHPMEEKRLRPVEQSFEAGEAPLRAVCVLGFGPELGLSMLDRQAAFVELLRHTFRVEWVRALQGEVAHMRSLTDLARKVPVWRLERPRGLERLQETLDAIEERWPR